MSFVDCVERSRAEGEITNEYADWLLKKWRNLNAARDPVRDRTELERRLAVAGAEKRRRDQLAAKAKKQMLDDVLNYRTPHGAQDMREAMYSLFEGYGHAGYPGLKQLHEAYLGLTHAKMGDVLETFRRTGLSGRRTSGPMARDVLKPSEFKRRLSEQVSMRDLRRASFGETVSPKAQALYNSFAEASEWARLKRNEMGGMTPKREDWRMPQSHNELAVAFAFREKDANAARERWSKFTNDRLDWTKMYDPLTGEFFPADVPEAHKLAILGHVWQTIATGGEINNLPKMGPTGKGSMATQGSEHRFLVFKDAQAASEYDREFGGENEFITMMDHLHRMASDIAMMQRLGPNPSVMIDLMKKMLDLEAAKVIAGAPHALGPKVNRSNALAAVEAAKNRLDAFYEQYRGERPSNNWKALAGRVAGNVATSALLGSSAIPHATSNWMIQSFARYAGGLPFAKVIPQLLNGFRGASHAEMLRAGLDFENGLYHIGTGANSLDKWSKIANWSKWLPDRTTHTFGLVPIVDANKNSFNHGMMSTLADQQKKGWADLPRFLRDKMQGYGMRERDWRVIQLAKPYAPAVGSAKWVRPNDVENLGATNADAVLHAYGRTSLDPTNDAKEAQKIAEDVGMRLRVYMMGEREIAVPQATMRGRAAIIGRSDPGSWWGLLRRSAGLFKGFASSFTIAQSHTMVRLNAYNKWHGAAYRTALAIAMMFGGVLAYSLKQASVGKDFPPLDPRTPSGFLTWLKGALTGLSGGIYGEFLSSERSSFGVGLLETLAGPVAEWPISAFEGIADTAKDAFAKFPHRGVGGTISHVAQVAGKGALKFVGSNTPLLTTGWPVRAVYRRMFIDQLMKGVDPDATHKFRMQEDRQRNDTGQHFAWRPGHLLPDRLPQFTPSR